MRAGSTLDLAGIFAVDGGMISLLELDNLLPPMAEAA